MVGQAEQPEKVNRDPSSMAMKPESEGSSPEVDAQQPQAPTQAEINMAILEKMKEMEEGIIELAKEVGRLKGSIMNEQPQKVNSNSESQVSESGLEKAISHALTGLGDFLSKIKPKDIFAAFKEGTPRDEPGYQEYQKWRAEMMRQTLRGLELRNDEREARIKGIELVRGERT